MSFFRRKLSDEEIMEYECPEVLPLWLKWKEKMQERLEQIGENCSDEELIHIMRQSFTELNLNPELIPTLNLCRTRESLFQLEQELLRKPFFLPKDQQSIDKMRLYPLDVLFVGGTGAGKSSVINALLGKNLAKVGKGSTPETQEIQSYFVTEHFRIHDSAGLGDGIDDERHMRNIIDILMQTVKINYKAYENKAEMPEALKNYCGVNNAFFEFEKIYTKGDRSAIPDYFTELNGTTWNVKPDIQGIDDSVPYGLIDMVVVIIDGGSRDLGTVSKLLRESIMPFIAPERILVVINQADQAMKGRHWDSVLQMPDKELADYFDQQAISVQTRLKESTGLDLDIKPIHHISAESNFELDRLVSHIIWNLPRKRRIIKIDEKTNKVIFD